MSAVSTPLTEKSRISSVDIARGIIMVIMALDHTRDYFHNDALLFNPTDLTKTNVYLFFTRFITHFCAPTFVLLSGVSISISRERKTTKQLSVYLLTRGLWLIVLDWTLMRFLMIFNLYYDMTILTVLWVIGLAMVCMSALVFLADRWLLILALIVVFVIGPLNLAIPGLTTLAVIPLSTSSNLIIAYPLAAWLAVMMIGYVLGSLYKKDFDPVKRQRILLIAGSVSIVSFIILRWINIYGDPNPWSPQSTSMFTFLSFLNVTKNPLSMLFTMMALGVTFILLALLDNVKSALLKPFHVFGRVPLFYFLLHFLVIHTGAIILFMIKTGKSFSELDFHFSKSFGGITSEGGFSLPGVYVAWIILIFILYPICKWYDQYKTTHKQGWLSYL